MFLRTRKSAPVSEESVTSALLRLLDLTNGYLCGHSQRVAEIASRTAAAMGLSEHEQRRARLAGALHDVGMVTVPTQTLLKPGALTQEERVAVQQHPRAGELILRGLGGNFDEIATIVLRHHEHFDGDGYPDRLKGEQVPLLARVVAVAEAFETMTSETPYRDAMPLRVARLRLAQAAGSQFDPAVVAALETIAATADGRASARRGR